MKFAPPTPTTPELLRKHPVNNEMLSRVINDREKVSTNLLHGFVGYVSACTLIDDPITLQKEGKVLSDLEHSDEYLTAGQRVCVWKPRSNPEELFWGLESINPTAAYRLLSTQANTGVSLSMEIGTPEHINRYGKFLSFGWIGARNSVIPDLASNISLTDRTLPLGAKNGTTGRIDETLELIEKLKSKRGADSAPITLIYRGGENARNPQDWEKEYIRALELTKGNLILDPSHGSGRAHDPNKKFERTSIGQQLCLEHAIELAHDGYVPAGALIEASEMESIIDPHIPFRIGVSAMQQLNILRKKQLNKL